VRILFLSPRQCWPARSGAKLREYHFLRALALDSELTYVHFTEPGAPPLTRQDLPFCREVVAVPKPPAYGAAQLIKGVMGRWPVPVLNYASAEMSATIGRLTDSTAFDLIHLDAIHMTRYVDPATAKIVYDWHNLESEAMRRYSATVASPARRWYAARTAAKWETLECEILRTAFGHVVCSARERDQLQRITPQARIAVVGNGVDIDYFAGAGSGASRRDLVFVGSMDYFPNVEAATAFSRQIWPLVRQRLPEARLLIVGANPGPAVLALAELPGVLVTGTVPDVRPYYRDALAAIVPLRTGGGTRLKILEAMAAGVPVISTPLGAEGLDVTPGRDILIAPPGDAEAWTGHVLALADPSNPIRPALVAAALDLARTHYDWEALGRTLRETYQGWLRGEPSAL
jgi:glycosyltransferase involved in cell wall biosynthesis